MELFSFPSFSFDYRVINVTDQDLQHVVVAMMNIEPSLATALVDILIKDRVAQEVALEVAGLLVAVVSAVVLIDIMILMIVLDLEDVAEKGGLVMIAQKTQKLLGILIIVSSWVIYPLIVLQMI